MNTTPLTDKQKHRVAYLARAALCLLPGGGDEDKANAVIDRIQNEGKVEMTPEERAVLLTNILLGLQVRA